MNRERIKLWVEALRSGDYRQGRKALMSADDGGYCCLGVACCVYADHHKEAGWFENRGNNVFSTDVAKYGKSIDTGRITSYSVLPSDVMDWFGLPDLDPALIEEESSYSEMEEIGAATLNDDQEWDFNEIADAIEKKFLESDLPA